MGKVDIPDKSVKLLKGICHETDYELDNLKHLVAVAIKQLDEVMKGTKDIGNFIAEVTATIDDLIQDGTLPKNARKLPKEKKN